ncbi:MAG: MBL fold metallo-hydrolase [Nanoarchaeota archaeon]|nr:MBL fold metallo-hydrolase [Nanoarchaeota archaeon]
MVKIIFHGAAGEVGKSCIEVQTKDKRYLLDAGVKFTSYGNEYPKELDKIHQLDGVFLSHAHLDHSGALPMLEHKQLNCPIYTTKMTWKTTNMLLQDSYHLEKLKHLHPAYLERDIKKVEKDVKHVKYDTEYETKDGKVKFQYLNSGHIPGGASILMNVEGKTLLYTADMNNEDTLLMVPSDVDKFQDIDILITENTYGDRIHPPREDCEKELIESVEECLRGGGSALIPVFSVGRAQEILILLDRLNIDAPIYLDGMARKLTEMYVKSDDPYINNKEILEKMFKKCHVVAKPTEREKIAHKKGAVIVSTSGMVQGGPVVTYVEKMCHDKDNYIILTGYQAKGTTGREILENKVFYKNHKKYSVKAQVMKYDFSAHYGQASIRDMLLKMKPKNLILQHGDCDALRATRAFAHENLTNTNVFLPAIGDIMEFTDEKSTITYKEGYKEKGYDKDN